MKTRNLPISVCQQFHANTDWIFTENFSRDVSAIKKKLTECQRPSFLFFYCCYVPDRQFLFVVRDECRHNIRVRPILASGTRYRPILPASVRYRYWKKCFDTRTDTAHASCLCKENNRSLFRQHTSKKEATPICA